MREGIRFREITNDESRRLLQIVRRSSGSVVRWGMAQMVLISAQADSDYAIAPSRLASSRDRSPVSCQ